MPSDWPRSGCSQGWLKTPVGPACSCRGHSWPLPIAACRLQLQILLPPSPKSIASIFIAEFCMVVGAAAHILTVLVVRNLHQLPLPHCLLRNLRVPTPSGSSLPLSLLGLQQIIWGMRLRKHSQLVSISASSSGLKRIQNPQNLFCSFWADKSILTLWSLVRLQSSSLSPRLKPCL